MGMIPIGDDDSDRTITPFVNYLLIAANVAVFVLLQGMGANDRFTYAFSTVPQEIVSGRDVVTPAHRIKDPASPASGRRGPSRACSEATRSSSRADACAC